MTASSATMHVQKMLPLGFLSRRTLAYVRGELARMGHLAVYMCGCG